MTQEEKELLLKDLCGRLPYETRVRYTFAFAGAACISGYSDEGILSYDKLQDFSLSNVGYETRKVVNILPYLRPMKSMTDEERKEWFKQSHVEYDCEFHPEPTVSLDNCHLSTDWLDKNMFDYRGLIPMGLAFPAEEGMYQQLKR